MSASVEEVRSRLEAELARWGDRGETRLDTGLEYRTGEPVRVLVRKRERRYDITDEGRAVKAAGVVDWRNVAQRTVDEFWLNINRGGVVSVGAVEGRDLAWLVQRVAEASRAVYSDLLDSAG